VGGGVGTGFVIAPFTGAIVIDSNNHKIMIIITNTATFFIVLISYLNISSAGALR